MTVSSTVDERRMIVCYRRQAIYGLPKLKLQDEEGPQRLHPFN
jgi:hypothetical protein